MKKKIEKMTDLLNEHNKEESEKTEGEIMQREPVDKLPNYMYEDVYQFYKSRLEEGIAITKIARLYNLKEQSNFAESTLRNKYEEYEKGAVASLREEDLIKRERLIDNREARSLLRNQKVLRREHMFKSQTREQAEVELVAEIAKEVYGEYDSSIDVKEFKVLKTKTKGVPFIIMGDVHAGYEYEGYYNDEIMIARLTKAFQEIFKYIKENDVKEINIAEMGDQIEGTGLRKSQLAYTSQMMTKQAALFEDIYSQLLEQLAEQVPDTKINVYFITSDNHSELRVHSTGAGNMKDHFAETIGRSLKREVDTAHKYGGLLNVNFILGDVHFLETADGRTIFLAHGHKHSGNMDKLPEQIYGDIGITPDIIITGHYHQFKLLTRHVRDGFMGMTVVAPSMVGDTDFSSTIHKSSHPGILIMEMDESNANFTFKPVN